MPTSRPRHPKPPIEKAIQYAEKLGWRVQLTRGGHSLLMHDETLQPGCKREYDFALIVGGVPELTNDVEDALFKAGCDDATLSIRYGLLFMEFSRSSVSIKDAIISAIHNVEAADTGAEVIRVDDCNLVTISDIARRIDRSRQMVHQYITGQRGPGGFPPPVCFVSDHKALWAWCAVSHWLAQNNILRPEDSWNAEVVSAINNALEMAQQRHRHPGLVNDVNRELNAT